ncbi:MAG: glycosyltransferase [Blastocatellia bacterium]
METNAGQKQNLLAVLLEDYFHVGAFNQLIQPDQWYRFESRYEKNTLAALDLLDKYQTRATFFTLGWIADRSPELLREITRRGHEIACRGYYNHDVARMTPREFRDDLARAGEAIERASGQIPAGYRAATPWRLERERWALEILAGQGYRYDTSVMTRGFDAHCLPAELYSQKIELASGAIWEFPVPSWSLLNWHIPISGGNYFRQAPHRLMKRAVTWWHERQDAPFIMYFHVWELDQQQPRISGASSLAQLRHYRNLGKLEWVIGDYLRDYRFTPFITFLAGANDGPAVSPARLSPAAHSAAIPCIETRAATPSDIVRPPVTIVIPCFNEEQTLPYLDNTLKSVEAALSCICQPQFLFVDDGSSDGTWDVLSRLFGGRAAFRLVRHARNRGIAAAILTGISHAETEIVCSMDCDCTYDPHELRKMIPLLTEGVDMVTASPYHPEGQVRNVPPWRLTLSKGASFLYRQVLRQQLSTYTSCFRVYRHAAIRELHLQEKGFLGVAEMLARLDLGGSKIIEHPATLEVRLFGRSKMKLLKTILGHLRLLARLAAARMSGPAPLAVGLEKTNTSVSVPEPPYQSLGIQPERNQP